MSDQRQIDLDLHVFIRALGLLPVLPPDARRELLKMTSQIRQGLQTRIAELDAEIEGSKNSENGEGG